MLSEFITSGDHLISEGVEFFGTDDLTHWDIQEPVFSFSGSDNSTPKANSSEEVNVMDERKRRRMISNRESARRSRMRKQKHIENLRNLLIRLKTGNKDLMNRLRVVNLHVKLVRKENQRLRSESVMLQQRLWDIHQVLRVRQLKHQLVPSAWLCNNNVTYI